MHAFITGASSGIGEALAHAFADAEYDLTLVARRAGELERVRAGIRGVLVFCLVADLYDLDGLAGLVDRAVAEQGPIDALVNNAGIQIVAPTDDVSVADGERLLTLNVLVPFRLTRRVLPDMLARGRGVIVDMASLSALASPPGMFHYSASKAALAAASESLRAEVRGHGVHVVTVYPGPVKTAMADAAVTRYEKDPTGALPVGNVETLARLVMEAIELRRARVIYPRPYALARMFPGISRWVTDRFSPIPKRLGSGVGSGVGSG